MKTTPRQSVLTVWGYLCLIQAEYNCCSHIDTLHEHESNILVYPMQLLLTPLCFDQQLFPFLMRVIEEKCLINNIFEGDDQIWI